MEKINHSLYFNVNNFQTAFRQQAVNPALRVNNFDNSLTTDTLNIQSESAQTWEIKAKSNPNILRLLRAHNLPVSVNRRALEELSSGHLRSTQILSANIYSSLPKEMKSQIDLKSLQDAAKYHDIGKILIPENILYKNSELNSDEWKIMKLHSELGAELLKDSGLSETTLNLVKYHHQTPNGKGYPEIANDYENIIEAQILSLADRYMALTEDRCYKKPLSRYEALEIIKRDLPDDALSVELFNALMKATA